MKTGKLQPVTVISSWGKTVSFTGVLRHIVAAFGKDRPVYVLALDQRGDVRCEQNITVIPVHCDGYQPLKAQLVFEAVRRIQPAAVFFYFDLFAAQYYYEVLLQIQRTIAPVVIYLPIDGALCNIHPLRPVTGVERVVFFTGAAQRRFLTLNADISTPAEQKFLENKCRVIGHGVNQRQFFPTEGGAPAAKRKVFPNHPGLENIPVILNGNRPWERKRLDLTLEGFARFLADNGPQAFLYLHLSGAAASERMAIENKIDELDIRRSVLLPNSTWTSVEGLNLIYNACEIGLNTAMGEGWGLISCEHGAAGAVQIVPDDEQQRDIWGSSALYAEISGKTGVWACPHVEYGVVDPGSVARSLGALCSDHSWMRERARAARVQMQDDRFSWARIEAQWAALFEEIMNRG